MKFNLDFFDLLSFILVGIIVVLVAVDTERGRWLDNDEDKTAATD